MKRMLTSLLGAAAVLAALASPAVAQEVEGRDWMWTANGKLCLRDECTATPYEASRTQTVVVAPGDRQEGDSWRMKYVGKRMEREYTREVPRSDADQEHASGWRLRSVGKHTEREYYCEEKGVEHDYHGRFVAPTYTAD
jgi:hypothetical protein